MSILSRIRGLFRPTAEILHGTQDGAQSSALARFLESNRLVTGLLFLVTVAALAVVSFVGTVPASLSLQPGQVAPIRIIANRDFSYESSARREREEDQVRARVPPVYRRDFSAMEAIERDLVQVVRELEALDLQRELGMSPDPVARIRMLGLQPGFMDEDVRGLAAIPTSAERKALAGAGLRVLRELYASGIRDPEVEAEEEGILAVIGGDAKGGFAGRGTVRFDHAATLLRTGLEAERIPEPALTVLFRILRSGLRPNLVFDEDATLRRQASAIAELGPSRVEFRAGQAIVEAGQPADEEVQEALAAYRASLVSQKLPAALSDERFYARLLQVFSVMLVALFYLGLHDPKTLSSNSRLALIVAVTLLNLVLVRLTLTLVGLPFVAGSQTATAVLPYLAPVTLAPLFLTILLGNGPGVFMALVVSFFSGVIHGGRFDVMVMSLLASLVAIYGCQTIRLRSQVVRSGAWSGFAAAAVLLLMGLADRVPIEVILLQMLAVFGVCTLTGFLVVGMLPVLESVFKRTTDITLLELTDFNHPLLRRLQMEAPGTYHHSLVVANLAENAAAVIGANPLLARVCALFHDIGKTVKPEYFTENQRGMHNPHDQRNPSMSALIIKSHVKEGVALAQEHRLPRPVVDCIRQHHGTTLMQFFFHRAKERVKAGRGVAAFPPEEVPEGVYRYDGPKPSFRESAILHLADSVEAAGRSLRKVTPQSVAELVEEITESRVNDGQLDECPLTLEELSRIKSSFTFTLLSMLHTRVSYPSGTHPATPATAEPGVVQLPESGRSGSPRPADDRTVI